jgi:hypothetical protein
VVQKAADLPGGNVRYEDVRDELMANCRERGLRQLMDSILSDLIGQAKVNILDPVLRRQYEQRRLQSGGRAPALVDE